VVGFVGGDPARGAEIFGLFGTTWALMQFIFAPLLGALPDRYGRRPVLILSAFGLGIDYIIMALAPNLTWLFIGRVISGITSASFTVSFAYVADTTPGERCRIHHRTPRRRPIGGNWTTISILGRGSTLARQRRIWTRRAARVAPYRAQKPSLT